MLTLGCDPEFALADMAGNLVSSIGIVGGSKKYPRTINDFGAVQEDNVLAEINIKPAQDKTSWVNNIKAVMEDFRKELSSKGLQLLIQDVMTYPKDILEQPGADEFGCEPDINAWLNQVNRLNPRHMARHNIRVAGGHIHVGSAIATVYPAITAQALDVFYTMYMLKTEDSSRRRWGYGRAGSYREKSYGIEYRTPSNFWLKSDKLIEQTYDIVESTNKFLNDNATSIHTISGYLKDNRYIIEQSINRNHPVSEEVYEKLVGGLYAIV